MIMRQGQAHGPSSAFGDLLEGQAVVLVVIWRRARVRELSFACEIRLNSQVPLARVYPALVSQPGSEW